MQDKDESISLLTFLEDSQKYFQKLVIWKETKQEFYLPKRNFKPIRHKKVLGTPESKDKDFFGIFNFL